MVEYYVSGLLVEDELPLPSDFRQIVGMAVVDCVELQADVLCELDGGHEEVRITHRHGRAWARVKLGGVYLYLTGPIPREPDA